jgi:hypothetical protein
MRANKFFFEKTVVKCCFYHPVQVFSALISENHMGYIEKSYDLIDFNGKLLKSFPNKYPFKNHDAFGIENENIPASEANLQDFPDAKVQRIYQILQVDSFCYY